MFADHLAEAILQESAATAEDWAKKINQAVPKVKARVEDQRGLAGDVILITHGQPGSVSVMRIGVRKRPAWEHGKPPPPKVKASYQMGKLHLPTKNGPIEKVVAHTITWLKKQDL